MRDDCRRQVIGITGSNGKSTVTEMVGAMLRTARTRTLVAGNIGLPILEALRIIEAGRRRRPDVFVLELSSFQLETRTASTSTRRGPELSEDTWTAYAGMREYARRRRASSRQRRAGDQPRRRVDARMAGSGRRVFTFGSTSPRRGRVGLRNLDGEPWSQQRTGQPHEGSELKGRAA